VTILWPWNPGYGSLKVIGIVTDRSATIDFLLTFHSSHGPISYRFRDRRRFQPQISKLAIRMRSITWPVSGGYQIVTYLESHTSSFFLAVQLSLGYKFSTMTVKDRALPLLSVFLYIYWRYQVHPSDRLPVRISEPYVVYYKTIMEGLQGREKVWWYLYPFRYSTGLWQTDTQWEH